MFFHSANAISNLDVKVSIKNGILKPNDGLSII